mmetsp:Transcript_12410/g.18799  ORF Transcript_12410/g.18799 Transcript_12410/m.18799 type:complete len:391 (-) Transcript_12410:189-1361(-)
MSVVIQELMIYPIKACRGVRVQKALVTQHGTFQHDREWCIVDSSGNRYPKMQSLSQRNCPVLASITVQLDEDNLTLEAPGMTPLIVNLTTSRSISSLVHIECGGASTTSAGSWHLGVLDGFDEGQEAADWLTTYLNKADTSKSKKPIARYMLVRASNTRSLARYAGPNQVPYNPDMSAQRLGEGSPFRMQAVPVAPHDGFLFHDVAPLHVTSMASFRDLQSKMTLLDPAPNKSELEAFDIEHFRPNVVVGGPHLTPWEEEKWSSFQLGRETFRLLKGCPRCTVPARNPQNGLFLFESKPLLAPQMALRKFWPDKCIDKEWEEEWQGPMFGIFVGHNIPEDQLSRQCILNVGDEVKVLKYKGQSPWLMLIRWIIFAGLVITFMVVVYVYCI